jgi:hypothetical protein
LAVGLDDTGPDDGDARTMSTPTGGNSYSRSHGGTSVPADRARAGRWIVVDHCGHETTHDPLSGEPFTEATANQEVAASRLIGLTAHAVFRQAI